MGAIYRNGYKYGDGNGVAQNPVLAIKSGNELYKPENGIVELPDFNEAIEDNAITNTASAAVITLSDTADSNPLALTVYGKSEIVDDAIISAGEGWSTVDLGTLDWVYRDDFEIKQFRAPLPQAVWTQDLDILQPIICSIYKNVTYRDYLNNDKCICRYYTSVDGLNVIDSTCTTLSQFLNKVNGVILAYKQVTPTDNAIAVKTDNGTGINGTMATFTTGTPLRGIPETDVRDVMEWSGSSGKVTKNCRKVRLADLTWVMYNTGGFAVNLADSPMGIISLICSKYSYDNSFIFFWDQFDNYNNKTLYRSTGQSVYIKDTDYTTVPDFVASLDDAELVYELATPITIPLTSSEVNAFKQLRTYDPNTTVSNNADSVTDIRYYKNSTNGNAVKDIDKAVDEVNERVPKKIETPHTTTEIDCGVAEDVTFSGLTYFRSNNIWTDGTDVYYSYATDQYVLSPLTHTWTAKTWTGLTDFYGGNIWTDGENIYYSYNENQYVLDKSTSTWSAKTWNGLSNFGGSNTWTDGENIYYSGSSNHYVLDKSTSTWSTKTWSSAPNYFSGNRVWSDGENIYYSAGTSQYVLDKDTSTWKAKTWNGLTSFSGDYIWTDGKNIYYSKNQEQYVLNKLTSTWIAKTWINTSYLQGTNVWTDGETLYCTENNKVHKKLTPSLTYKSVRLR